MNSRNTWTNKRKKNTRVKCLNKKLAKCDTKTDPFVTHVCRIVPNSEKEKRIHCSHSFSVIIIPQSHYGPKLSPYFQLFFMQIIDNVRGVRTKNRVKIKESRGLMWSRPFRLSRDRKPTVFWGRATLGSCDLQFIFLNWYLLLHSVIPKLCILCLI